MYTMARIVQVLNALSLGQLATTRQFLGMGSRGAVDQALYRLVKEGFIVRVARGVFIRRGSPMPTALEVAKAKAAAFCKQIYEHGADAAHALGFCNEPNEMPIFACSGRSSSFRFGKIVIRFIGVSPRKLHNGDSLSGRLIRAMWHKGKDACTTGIMAQTYPNWSSAMSEMRASAPVLAHWMNNLFYWGRREPRLAAHGLSIVLGPVDWGELFPDFKEFFK